MLQLDTRFKTNKEITFGIMPPILYGTFKDNTIYTVKRITDLGLEIKSEVNNGCSELIKINHLELEKIIDDIIII